MGNWREEKAKGKLNGHDAAQKETIREEISEEDFLEDMEAVEKGIFEGTERKSFVSEGVPSNVPSDLEFNARLTMYKMIAAVPKLEEPYQFKTVRFGGKAHVQAMRQALSRARADLRAAGKKPGVEFKFFLVSIEHFPTHDLVTAVRSAHPSLKQKRAHDDIMQLLETETGDNGETT